MKRITAEHIERLAPSARSSYRKAFEEADGVLAGHGINDTALRLAHFIAQLLHECGGLTILRENMNYTAARMMDVWPSRFPTLASAQPFAHNPEKLANKVYGGRMGNDNPGDGWTYRGRGMMQVTGRESYEKYGSRLGIDLTGDPELAIDSAWSLRIAAEEWAASGCNAFADADSIHKVTRAINGGLTGLGDRKDWLVKTKNIWH